MHLTPNRQDVTSVTLKNTVSRDFFHEVTTVIVHRQHGGGILGLTSGLVSLLMLLI